MARVTADIAFGQPTQNARCVIVSTSSSSVTPFLIAFGKWNRLAGCFALVAFANTALASVDRDAAMHGAKTAMHGAKTD